MAAAVIKLPVSVVVIQYESGKEGIKAAFAIFNCIRTDNCCRTRY